MSTPSASRAPLATGEANIPAYLLAPVKRWRLTLFCLALSALVAGAAAYKYGQQSWPVEGTIIYTPLPIASHPYSDYTPPSSQTLISLVKSGERLQKVVDELALPVPAKTLDRSLKVNPQANADVVRLALDWPDPERGRAILDCLTAAFIHDMIELRRGKIQETMALLQTERAAYGQQLASAKAAYAALPDNLTRARLQVELTRNSGSATALTTEYNQVAEKLTAVRRNMARTKEKLTADEFSLDEVEGVFHERVQILMDSIRLQDDKVKETDVEIEYKKKDLDNQAKIVNSGVGSRLDHTRLTGDLQLLTVRRESAIAAAKELRKELAELPRRQARNALIRYEDDEKQLEQRAATLKTSLEENRSEMARLGDLATSEQQVAKRVELAEANVQGINSRIAGMERLRDGTITEFAAAHPAMVAGPPSSNRKSLAVMVFGLLATLTIGGIVGHAFLTRPVERSRPTCGLPILATVGNEDEITHGHRRDAAEVRRLALQLREPISHSGGLILIAPAERTVLSGDLVFQLARYQALRGESVLILDARVPDMSSTATAVNSVLETQVFPTKGSTKPTTQTQNPFASPDDLVHKTRLWIRKLGDTGVSYLPAQKAFPDTDSLTSVAMQRLLVQLSDDYDRVFLLGSPLAQSIGAEILACYADGAIVVFRSDAEESAECRREVEAIRAAGIPWIGAVVRTGRAGEGDGMTPLAPETLTSETRLTRTPSPGQQDPADEEESVLNIAWS